MSKAFIWVYSPPLNAGGISTFLHVFNGTHGDMATWSWRLNSAHNSGLYTKDKNSGSSWRVCLQCLDSKVQFSTLCPRETKWTQHSDKGKLLDKGINKRTNTNRIQYAQDWCCIISLMHNSHDVVSNNFYFTGSDIRSSILSCLIIPVSNMLAMRCRIFSMRWRIVSLAWKSKGAYPSGPAWPLGMPDEYRDSEYRCYAVVNTGSDSGQICRWLISSSITRHWLNILSIQCWRCSP